MVSSWMTQERDQCRVALFRRPSRTSRRRSRFLGTLPGKKEYRPTCFGMLFRHTGELPAPFPSMCSSEPAPHVQITRFRQSPALFEVRCLPDRMLRRLPSAERDRKFRGSDSTIFSSISTASLIRPAGDRQVIISAGCSSLLCSHRKPGTV